MKIRYAWIVFVLAAMLLGGAAAHAGDKMGIYGAVKGGWSGTTYSKNGVTDANAAATNQNATNESFKTPDQYVFGGAIGYNWAAAFKIPIRSELEYMYRGNMLKYDADNATSGGATATFSSKVTSIQTLMANFFYDINTGTAFTPYVGAGVGLAWIETKFSSNFAGWAGDTKKTASNLAWNVGAGLGYSITDNFILDLGYRYVSFGDAKDAGDARYSQKFKNLGAHEALLGLRFEF